MSPGAVGAGEVAVHPARIKNRMRLKNFAAGRGKESHIVNLELRQMVLVYYKRFVGHNLTIITQYFARFFKSPEG